MKTKFRIWDSAGNKYHYFDLRSMTVQDDHILARNCHSTLDQHIGVCDDSLQLIYERDVIQHEMCDAILIGEVFYEETSAAYYIGDYPIINHPLSSLQIIGNMKTYHYNEKGELTKNESDT